MSDRGFTLVDLLVAIVLSAILGTALVRMLVSDSRFVSRQDAMISARRTARAGLNSVSLEVRMVSDGGLVAAAPDSVVLRVPYVFGMACRTTASKTISALVPADSLTYATATPSGIAWRNTVGTYRFTTFTALASSIDTASCRADSVRVIPGGRLVEISGIPSLDVPPPGSLMFLHQRVTYRFAPSAELPGRKALWRRVAGGTDEELVAPFGSASQFAFLVGPDLQSTPTAPSDLSTVRGLELRLIGESEHAAEGEVAPETFTLNANVPFLNKIN